MKHVIAVTLAVLEVVVILFSWITTSVAPSLPFRSVLSGEGVRWFFGNFVDNMSSGMLVWIILCSIAYGAFTRSGLRQIMPCLLGKGKLAHRQRHAVLVVSFLLLVIVFVVILLAFIPHAVLLGVSGSLFPSAFSAAFVPILAFAVTLLSMVYGVVSGAFSSVNDAFRSLYAGIVMFAPVFPIYVLAAQLYYTVLFVFF